jgi:4-hydroxybenzoate polyprenyltransferase
LAVPVLVSTVLIAAAGYVINNIFDQDTDLENKPNRVVIGKALLNLRPNIYAVLNISGVAIGFYLSNDCKALFAAILF